VPDAKVFASIICFIRADGRECSYMTTDFNEDLLSARTGTDGRFRIEGLPTNSAVDLIVRKKGKAYVNSAGAGFQPDTMTARAGQQDIKLKMQPAGSIEGKLLIPKEGRDLPVYLTLQNKAGAGGKRPQAQTTADGSFRFDDLAAGSYQIFSTFGTNKLPEWVAKRQIVSVEAGKATRDVKITAVKGGVLEVAALSTVGPQPLQGVVVSVLVWTPPQLERAVALLGRTDCT
jgi:hypothetical protein